MPRYFPSFFGACFIAHSRGGSGPVWRVDFPARSHRIATLPAESVNHGPGALKARAMKTKIVLLFALFLHAPFAFAQSTAFTYQGRLTDNGSPANGNYDLQFTVRDSASGGNLIA